MTEATPHRWMAVLRDSLTAGILFGQQAVTHPDRHNGPPFETARFSCYPQTTAPCANSSFDFEKTMRSISTYSRLFCEFTLQSSPAINGWFGPPSNHSLSHWS